MSSSQVSQIEPHVRDVLVAPLWLGSVRWTSNDVANSLGISQTKVARTWRRTFAPLRDEAAARVHTFAGELVGISFNQQNSTIALRRRHRPVRDVPPDFMRQARRLPLQTILATDQWREAVPPDDIDVGTRLWNRLVWHGHPAADLLLVSRVSLPQVPQESVLVIEEPERWQRLLADLVVVTSDTPLTTLRQVQAQCNEWATHLRPRFEWLAPSGRNPEHGVPAQPAPLPRPLGQAVADDAFRNILGRITSGQLVGGDRITESSLQRALRTSRTQVRDAMRTLALAGLVDLEPNRGAIVPVPDAQDVLDTYDARLALGILLVERVAAASKRDLTAAETALSLMLNLAETSDSRATGDADVRFQDALMSSASMPQVQSMFRALSSQVMLFTAVLGLKYVYSIPEMCRDNLAIMEAVRSRNPELAGQLWERKVDAAKQFMAAHL